MTDAKHTPTPWRAKIEPGVGYMIHPMGVVVPDHYKEYHHDADIIVRAVNSHATLVRALTETLKCAEDLWQHGDFKNGNTDPSGSTDEGDSLTNAYVGRVRETARAALALATQPA